MNIKLFVKLRKVGHLHLLTLPFFLNCLFIMFSFTAAGASCSSSTQTALPPHAGEERQDGGGGDHTGVTDRQAGRRL